MPSSLIIPNKCVYFIGPGSTGKTTLTKAVWKKCSPETSMLTEVARTVLRKLKYTANDISSDPIKCYNLQKAIFVEQCDKERELLETNRKFISDRSAIDPLVYAEFYINGNTFDPFLDLEDTKWHEIKLRYQDERNTLIVLIEPNESFLKNDGTRKMPTDLEEWKSFYRCFLSFMNKNQIPFKIIPSNVTNICQRTDQVIHWMQY